MATKPSIPKGTRDFSPVEMVRRNYILDTIKTVYQKFGFQQIETPTMENLSVLEGKYGEEGDKLLYRILNSGPVIDEIKSKSSEVKISDIAEKGLRYDLTVPFARYVVMHQNEITFPFKRYQIQPVWRADRPQKGRYREFYQCDADVIGSDSLLNEVEMIQMIDEVFSKFGMTVTIKINNRKILQGIAEYCGCSDKFIDLTVAIDKYDKIGEKGVIEELKAKGFSEKRLEIILACVFPSEDDYIYYTYDELISFDYSDEEAKYELKVQESKYRKDLGVLNCLDWNFRGKNENFPINKEISVGIKGVEEMKEVFDTINLFTIPNKLEFSNILARGLNYYTGAIFEVKINDSRSTFTSSVLGGGRYDDLTGIFGLPNVSGVGISFGVDRIYDVMEEMKLFDELNLQSSTTQIMFVNFGKEEEKYCLKLLQQIRAAGINAEIYPDSAKMKKQMSYADDKKIPFVVLLGSEEMKTGELTLKNMQTGEQEKISIDNLIKIV